MSRSELERLVSDAEARAGLRLLLQGCQDSEELVRLARRLGYGVTTGDLERARQEHEQAAGDGGGLLLP
ncbi:MAG: Nif11-like leader peptide family natural product precursor [Cyanobacteriota bacterium]|nr:Nif11-like leader peptide family natural product precursor [Cyanobacteriota bacterium]